VLDQRQVSVAGRTKPIMRPRPRAVENSRIDDVGVTAMKAAEECPGDSRPHLWAEAPIVQRLIDETKRAA
jgi:hypothetical protein